MTRDQIGERVAVVETLIAGMAEKLDKIIANQESGASDRAQMRAALEAMDARLKDVEPVVKDVRQWRERVIGARMAMVALWVLIGGSIASIASWAMKAAGLWPR